MTAPPSPGVAGLSHAAVGAMFAAFAFAYFFSALLRAVTATLAPVFGAELGLGAAQLGLLAGAYFLGFSAMQLPLGSALDRWGPKRVLIAFVSLAVAGCAAFAAAHGFAQMLGARMLIGVGVSACLMAPLTAFRRHLSGAAQLRANSWMLMTGSLGMLASTRPTQWLLPGLGWRGLFWLVAAMLALAMLLLWRLVPRDAPATPALPAAPSAALAGGYGVVFANPVFVRHAPLGVVAYGGLVAMQSLWIGPWLTQVAGRTPEEAARGLFAVNLAMLLAFLGWGLAMPRLARRGWPAERLVAAAWPPGIAMLAWIVWLGPEAGAGHWAAWCVLTSIVSLTQPVVGQAFAAAQAGRALSAFNLMIFVGVFVLQWGIGLAIDALRGGGSTPVQAFRTTFAAFDVAAAASFGWLVLRRARDGTSARRAGPG